MKRLIFKSLFVFTFISILCSCQTMMSISNGAYSDISLVRESKDYSLKRLKEVNSESSAIFGIPFDKSLDRKQGIIVRFNGINVSGSKRILPILTMIALTLPTGYAINELAGYKREKIEGYSFTVPTDERRLGLPVSTILAIPISGAINNQIWFNSAYSRAAYDVNNRLLFENPNIDVFLNPKYEIDNKVGVWTQRAKLNAKVMGATLKEDN